MANWPDLIVVTGLGVQKMINNELEEVLVQEAIEERLSKKELEGVGRNGKNILLYGCTWSADTIYLGGVRDVFAIKEGEIKIIKFKDRSKATGFHQISFYGDKLYVANTGENCLYGVDLNSGEVKICDLTKTDNESPGGDTDFTHINSVFCNGENVFVVNHNFAHPSYISVLDMDLNHGYDICNVGQQNHNAYVDKDNILYSLSSKTAEIVKIDLNTGRVEKTPVDPERTITQKDVYLRGLAKTEDHFVIGVTPSHGRDERDKVTSWLLLYDNHLNFLEAKSTLPLGQIREIRAIHEPDFAHNPFEFPL